MGKIRTEVKTWNKFFLANQRTRKLVVEKYPRRCDNDKRGLYRRVLFPLIFVISCYEWLSEHKPLFIIIITELKAILVFINKTLEMN